MGLVARVLPELQSLLGQLVSGVGCRSVCLLGHRLHLDVARDEDLNKYTQTLVSSPTMMMLEN